MKTRRARKSYDIIFHKTEKHEIEIRLVGFELDNQTFCDLSKRIFTLGIVSIKEKKKKLKKF